MFVDNASTDGSVELLERTCADRPQALLIKNRTNRGYTGAANQGISASSGKYVLLLNPDAVLRPGAIEGLMARFADPEVAAVGPVSGYVAGQQHVRHHVPRHFGRKSHDELHEYLAREMKGRSILTKLLIGFCLMIRRDVLDTVGYLDEDLFLGSDDVELSWRLRLHGYKLAIARDVYVEHIGGTSFATADKAWVQEKLNESTRVLLEKLKRHYWPNPVPSGEELWGIPILPGS